MRYVLTGLMLGWIVIFAAACISIPTGDGGTIKLSKDGATVKTADGDELSLNVDTEAEAYTYSGVDADGNTFQSTIGVSETLPAQFPKDIPIPDDVQLTVIENTLDGQHHYSVSFEAQGSVAEHYQTYRTYIDQSNYEDVFDSKGVEAYEDSFFEYISATSGKYSLAVSIMNTGTGEFDDDGVMISITYFENE